MTDAEYNELRKKWDQSKKRAENNAGENKRSFGARVAAAKREHGDNEWADKFDRDHG